MTSLSCGVDALLRAAEFLEKQESTTTSGQLRPVVVESLQQISTGKRQFFVLFCKKFCEYFIFSLAFRQKAVTLLSATLNLKKTATKRIKKCMEKKLRCVARLLLFESVCVCVHGKSCSQVFSLSFSLSRVLSRKIKQRC
jgi:hypothetical protein